MTAAPAIFALLLSLSTILPSTNAQSAAPAPAPSGPINITGILDKAGQFSFFIGLLRRTQADSQIDNQVNNSRDGMTVFAPTDNAFNNLPGGALNNLSSQQQVQLVQYHICPKFYSFEDFRSAPNPVRTQASGQDNKVFGLYIAAEANQLNISTGVVDVPVYEGNAVRKDAPLAVYRLDKVLLPREFYDADAPTASPPAPPAAKKGGSGSGSGSSAAAAPSTENPAGNGAGRIDLGLGLTSAVGLLGLGFLF
ncbi:fasciclin-like arabinogalactan protein 9 [Andrographis paniculata]|uniref:fasciclin-like arabinogalactan protein 9 n=1 Tax=Andrographis paniculata TaxID=175694 RepID=UPI0021E80B57|nr:fasciclin-like arabinogalactan protein 9 [Andrographis paniculata]